MAARPKLLIIAAPFYEDITEQLVEGATAALTEAGAAFEIIEVPGAFEIPGVIAMAEAGKAPYDGYVAPAASSAVRPAITTMCAGNPRGA